MYTHKYVTKAILKEVNNAAIREKRNRFIDTKIIESIPDDYKFIIHRFIHTIKDELRIIIKDSEVGSQCVDISRERYEMLPGVVFLEDGNTEFEDISVVNSRSPYPNGREWKRSITKAPVRKQKSFRKKILEAYNSECALCGLQEVNLLRASHILPVAEGGSDEINNGICLCLNHEVAFDKGIILIKSDYSVEYLTNARVLLASSWLNLPANIENWPDKQSLGEKLSITKKTDNGSCSLCAGEGA
ncbi:HNH endonuclease [Skermanella rosea]|uniref:HNH endonuclease n=1 Tax=Skermanella rosea TaxID=1817965 RepID=UPI001933B798|nr:HNH endonuclease [Skermanella rosea]UEM02536.1 HNH endonuclease [Skermanella rosea]